MTTLPANPADQTPPTAPANAAVDLTFGPNPDEGVLALTGLSTSIFAGGLLDTAGGVEHEGLAIFGPIFRGVRGIMYNTHEEQALVTAYKRYLGQNPPPMEVSVKIDPTTGTERPSAESPAGMHASAPPTKRSAMSSSMQPPDTDPTARPSARSASIEPGGRGDEPQVETTVAMAARPYSSSQLRATSHVSPGRTT